MSRSLSHFFGEGVLLGSRTRKPVKQFEVAEEPKKYSKYLICTFKIFSERHLTPFFYYYFFSNTNAKKKNGGNKENNDPNEYDSYYSDEDSYEEPAAKKTASRSDGAKRATKKAVRYIPESEEDESDGMDSIEVNGLNL